MVSAVSVSVVFSEHAGIMNQLGLSESLFESCVCIFILLTADRVWYILRSTFLLILANNSDKLDDKQGPKSS